MADWRWAKAANTNGAEDATNPSRKMFLMLPSPTTLATAETFDDLAYKICKSCIVIMLSIDQQR